MSNKTDELFVSLTAGWCQADSLAAANGWLPHTLRAVISVEARKRGARIERKREDGKTFYRIASE